MICSTCPGSACTSPSRGSSAELELAAFAHEQAEHPLEIAHARVEIDPLGAQQLPAAERKQLAREPRGAVRCLHDLVDELVRFVGRRDRHLQQRSEALDRREQVVEVVRDAAREQPDRLHLLCRAQLRLEPPLLRHVAPVHRHHVADEHRVDLVPASLLGFKMLEVDGTLHGARATQLVGARGVLQRGERNPD